jgi:hypothetical protein
VVWKADQESWARLHEEAFRAFGGSVAYVVLDNLKQGVIKPDLYEPQLNPVYAALLAHYSAIADVARVADPNRKGSVERAIQHTQDTALKGRQFDSIEAQNAHLAHWEESWAAPRIHGRKKRQVLALFEEEKPHLKPLPLEGFRYFHQETRTVDDAGLIVIEQKYYPALPAPLYSEVKKCRRRAFRTTRSFLSAMVRGRCSFGTEAPFRNPTWRSRPSGGRRIRRRASKALTAPAVSTHVSAHGAAP